MKKNRFIYLFPLFSFLFACSSDDGNEIIKSQDQLNHEMAKNNDELIYSLRQLDLVTPSPPVAKDDPIVVDEDLEKVYFEQTYEESSEIPEINLLDSKSHRFFPGALFDGQSILDSQYTPIVVDRKPIRISTSLLGKGSEVEIEVADPKLSTVRDAVNKLITQDFDIPPASMSYDISEVHDEAHLKLALAASYESGLGNLSSSFDFKNKSKVSRTIFKFKQVYYTLDLDLPSRPSDFFSSTLDPSVFKGKSPVYVSNVTFGRQIYLTVESSLSSAEVKASLDGMFKFVGQFSANAEAEFSKLYNTSTIKSVVIGGGSDNASANIGSINELKTLISSGGKFGKDNPGVPIAFTLRNLKDNTKFKTVLTAKYKKRFVRPKSVKKFDARFRVLSITNTFNANRAPSSFKITKNQPTVQTSTATSLNNYQTVSNVNLKEDDIWYEVFIGGKYIKFRINKNKLTNAYYKCNCSYLFTEDKPLLIQAVDFEDNPLDFYMKLEVSQFTSK